MHVLVVFMAIISTLEYMYVVGKRDRKQNGASVYTCIYT